MQPVTLSKQDAACVCRCALTLLLVPAFLPLAANVTSTEPLLTSVANNHVLLGTATQLMDTPKPHAAMFCCKHDYMCPMP